jgi:hypothetical protein
MSDFDEVLERLMIEPSFRTALATDPARTLAGYRLSADELDLLHTQLTGDHGATGRVEERTSKASLAGLFGPLLDLAGGGRSAALHHGSAQGLSDVPAGGASQGLSDLGADQGLSDLGAADQGLSGVGDADQGLSDISGADQGLSDVTAADQGLSDVGGTAPVAHSGSELHHAGAGAPVGYHPHIDADGDGRWDTYTTRRAADGGIDILVDRNHDGVTDFVGHDRNGDGLVESADYDEDFNGSYETHMRDVNGDGWLDTRQVDRP